MPLKRPEVSRLRVIDGPLALARGAAFVLRTPSVWPAAATPVLIAGVLFLGLGIGSVVGANSLATQVFAGEHAAWSVVLRWALTLAFAAAFLAVAAVVAWALAQPLAGPALESLVRAQQRSLGIDSPQPQESFIASCMRSLRVTLTAVLLSVPVLAALSLIGLLFPPANVVVVPLAFVVSSVAVAYDLLDYPLGIRGMNVRARFRFLWHERSVVLGFGASVTALLLIPGIGLIVLPFAVAGATQLVVWTEASAPRHALVNRH